MKGLSRSNLKYMRQMAGAWPAQAASPHGWSRSMLLHQIKAQTHVRVGAAPSNFAQRLPRRVPPQGHALEPLRLCPGQVLHQPDGRPARRQHRRPQLGLVKTVDDRQHRLPLLVEEVPQPLTLAMTLFAHATTIGSEPDVSPRPSLRARKVCQWAVVQAVVGDAQGRQVLGS